MNDRATGEHGPPVWSLGLTMSLISSQFPAYLGAYSAHNYCNPWTLITEDIEMSLCQVHSEQILNGWTSFQPWNKANMCTWGFPLMIRVGSGLTSLLMIGTLSICSNTSWLIALIQSLDHLLRLSIVKSSLKNQKSTIWDFYHMFVSQREMGKSDNSLTVS